MKRSAIFSVGRCSISLTSATITGVSAAAYGVPLIQNWEVITAAVADAALAIASVRRLMRRSSSRVLRAREDIARETSDGRTGGTAPGRPSDTVAR